MGRFAGKMAGIALVLVLVMALAGCRNDDERIQLNVLNYFSLATPGAIAEINMVWQQFEKDNPDIKVVREDAFEEPFHLTTEAYAAAGELPDVLYVWPGGRSTTLHSRGLLRDLSSFAARDGLADVFTPVSLDPAHQAGGYLAMIPVGMTTTSAFYVNHEVLDAAGLQPATTYAELVTQVPVLREMGFETVIMANADTWVMQSCLFSMIAGRFGGEGWEQRILNGTARFTDPGFLNALRFIQQMYRDGVLSQGTLATSYGDTPGMFATNMGAYMIDGDWRAGAFITDASTGRALITPERQRNISIGVFPTIAGARLNDSASVVMSTGWGMSSAIEPGSAREEAAWRLISWLTGREVQTFMVGNGGLPSPSRTDVDVAGMPLEPMQVSIANLGRTFGRSTAVIDSAFEGAVYGPLNDGLQALGLGTQTPEQVAAITQAAFDAWKAVR
ncbi:MAG: extracellular solute-binding protein [Treponema sp.]|nr:extracellular solute-binding protein [Treponema sp.]